MHLATSISFPGNARSAFELHHQLLGGELQMHTYGHRNLDPAPGVDAHSIAHAELVSPHGRFIGDDARNLPLTDTAYSLAVWQDSPEQAEELVDALLAAGATEGEAFGSAPWGGHYGNLHDPFGVFWSILSND